jgi:3-oxoacyl-[acyl-carrier-protein] synthase-3
VSETGERTASRNRATAARYAARAEDPRLQTAGIAAVASAAPANTVSTSEVEERLGLAPGWISSRTGVAERHIATAGESLTELAAQAGGEALARAGIHPARVELVLVATFTPDDLLPHAAPLVAERLGANGAAAIDVGAACTGFLSALALATAQIEARRARVVLVIGAEVISRVTDHEDRATAGLFGDGAGAAVLVAGPSGGSIGPVLLGSDGQGAGCIRASHDQRQVHMDGRPTFRAAVAAMSKVTVEAAGREGLGLDEVDLFIYHQANRRILTGVGERLGLDPDRVFDCVDRYGNTSAASIPIALAEAAAEGRLAPGDQVLLAAFGAGFTWGATVVEWGEAA